MQKLILAGLLFSFLLSACDSGRNIDVADRERRMGAGGGNSSAGGALDKDLYIMNLNVREAQFLDADTKMTFRLGFTFFYKSKYSTLETLFLVDLQTQLLYLYEPSGMKEIGSIECTSAGPSPCQKFKMSETFSTFFPELKVQSILNRVIEIESLSSFGEYDLQKKIDDVWTSMGTLSGLVFNLDYGVIVKSKAPVPFIFHSFPGADAAIKPTWFYSYSATIDRAFPFYDPVPGYRLIEISDEKTESETSFIATYLNLSTGQTLTQQYRVENVQK
ncbi:hypothetical protein D3C87_1023430 [compost metagenome]